MAAPSTTAALPSALSPCFAVVCSFLERYGSALDLPELTFTELERYLQETSAVPQPLIELHVKLLRKIGKTVTPDRWEKYLIKVCQEFNSTWAWELESKSYSEMTVEWKTRILKFLCESQFDDNLKFKTLVNEEDPDKMRLQPIGRDKEGLLYWFQLDQDQNVRMYAEEQDDLEGSSWRCIARTRNDLAETLEQLKAKMDSSVNQEQLDGSTSPSVETEDKKGEIGDCGSEQKDLTNSVIYSTEIIKRETITDAAKPEKEDKDEAVLKDAETAKPTLEPVPIIDNRVSTIKSLIKEESEDCSRTWNAVSVVMIPSAVKQEQPIKSEIHEDANELRFENVSRAIKSDQQNKIPLKKRELKRSGGYDNSNHHGNINHNNNLNSNGSISTGGIIVRNPAVPPVKEQHMRSEHPTEKQTVSHTAGPQDSNIRPPCEEMRVESCQKTVREQCVSVGVIMGPLERKSLLTENDDTPAKNSNGLQRHGDALKFGAGCSDGVRQSVLVGNHMVKTDNGTTSCSLPEELSSKDVSKKCPDISERSSHQVEQESPTTDEMKKPVFEEKSEKEQEAIKIKNSRTAAFSDRGETAVIAENEVKDESMTSSRKRSSGKSKSKLCRKDLQNTKPSSRIDEVLGRDAEEGVNFGCNDDEEVSSELQKEGIRLKIKIPLHRRTPELQHKDIKSETSNRRSLRRSPRICKPSPKMADGRVGKQDRKLPSSSAAQDEEENMEDIEVKVQSKKEVDKKADVEGQTKSLKGKRRHRRPRWSKTRNKSFKSKGVLEGGEDVGDDKATNDEDNKSESDNKSETDQSNELPPEDACKHCGLTNHPELILLCDMCDSGYHTACLRPPLMIIPDGQWFCPPCQHKLLCEKLEEQLQNLDTALKKRERAERRRERLVYVGISVENIIPTPDGDAEDGVTEKKKDTKKSKSLGRRSTRMRKSISYRFDDFDEAIDEAIEDDLQDTHAAGAGRGEHVVTVTGPQRITASRESRRSVKPVSPRKRKRRRLNDLDSDSTVDEEESEDEFQMNDSLEEEFVVSGDDEGEAGSDEWSSAESDAGSQPTSRRSSRYTHIQRARRSRRRWRASSEEELLDSGEEEMETEGSNGFIESGDDTSRRHLRRSQNSHVNYYETSESEGSQKVSKQKNLPLRHRRRLSSSNSEESILSEDFEPKALQRRERGQRREQSKQHKALKQRQQRSSSEEEENSEEGGETAESEEDKQPLHKRSKHIETDEEEEDLEQRQQNTRGKISRLKHTVRHKAGPQGLTRHNGLIPLRSTAQDDNEDEDEEEFTGVTDLVNFVFDSEQLS